MLLKHERVFAKKIKLNHSLARIDDLNQISIVKQSSLQFGEGFAQNEFVLYVQDPLL